MLTPVTCQCGKQFAAQPHLAGKRVKCPACAQPILIPDKLAVQTQPSQPETGAALTVVECQCGKKFQAPGHLLGKRIRCPGCGQPLSIPNSSISSAVKEPLLHDTPLDGTLPDDVLGTLQTARPTLGDSSPWTSDGSFWKKPDESSADDETETEQDGEDGEWTHKKTGIVIAIIGGAGTILLLIASIAVATFFFYERGGMAPSAKTADPDSWEVIERNARKRSATASIPDGPLVYQPMFVWQDAAPTFQGTGFLTLAPAGDTVGITSAHFIDFQGPALEEAHWFEMQAIEPIATFTHSYGAPGNSGTDDDLRPDYMIFTAGPSGIKITNRPLLELDTRLRPKVGERVWLPNKSPENSQGHVLVEGTVVSARVNYSIVVFDDSFQLVSQSGSPLISQQTGQVIGTLSRGGELEGRPFVMIAPAAAIVEALKSRFDHHLLRDVVGADQP